MRFLLFLARVAVVCNVFFLVCVILRYTSIDLEQAVNGIIIVLGWFLSVILNVVVHVILIGRKIVQKQVQLPAFLLIFNLFWFIFQIFYFLIF